jgi:hypothetical protein
LKGYSKELQSDYSKVATMEMDVRLPLNFLMESLLCGMDGWEDHHPGLQFQPFCGQRKLTKWHLLGNYQPVMMDI